MKNFRKFDAVIVGDTIDRIVKPLREDMRRKGLKSLKHGNLKAVNTKMGLVFTDGHGEVAYLNNYTAVMDVTMANTSVGKIEADLYALHKLICA